MGLMLSFVVLKCWENNHSTQRNSNVSSKPDLDSMKTTVMDHIALGGCEASTSSLCRRSIETPVLEQKSPRNFHPPTRCEKGEAGQKGTSEGSEIQEQH